MKSELSFTCCFLLIAGVVMALRNRMGRGFPPLDHQWKDLKKLYYCQLCLGKPKQKRHTNARQNSISGTDSFRAGAIAELVGDNGQNQSELAYSNWKEQISRSKHASFGPTHSSSIRFRLCLEYGTEIVNAVVDTSESEKEEYRC